MRISTTAACVLGALWAATPVSAQTTSAAEGRQHNGTSRALQAPRLVRMEQQDAQRPAAPAKPQGTWTVGVPFTRTLPIGGRNTLELNLSYGSVVITGVSNSSNVAITANRRVMMQSRDAALTALKNVSPQITQRGGGIEIITGLPDGLRVPILVDYEIAVPSTTAVSLSSWGGEIRVTNVGGELRVEANGNGDVTISNAGRIRKAKALNGSVTINGMEGDELNVETLRGNMQVRNVTAQNMELKSISGAITINNASCDRCTISSLSGNVEMIGPLRPDARLTVKTNNGNVRLVPTGNVRFDLEALTTGTKQSDFPLKSRATELRMLRGSYGDVEGSTIISISSFTGNITVNRP